MRARRHKEAADQPACREPGEDEVCSDEVKHGQRPEDPAMLDGTLIDAGGAIAGLVPIELPEVPERKPTDEGGCDGCR